MKKTATQLGITAGVVGAMLTSLSVGATELDLTTAGNALQLFNGSTGGTAYFGNFNGHPTGTGVYQPFLDLQESTHGAYGNNIEGAYNTDGATAMYLDQARSQWNHLVKLQDLQTVTGPEGKSFYVFELDANEPSGGTSELLSIDNIRIYTSPTDNTALVGNDDSKLDSLGTLRWAMNDPLRDNANNLIIDNWIKLDSTQSDTFANANGGSGYSDMLAYIPVTAFAGASASDYLFFYNLNGVHYTAEAGTAAQAGYEEWRYVAGPSGVPPVPDGGTTALLLGMALSGIAAIRRYCQN